MKYSFSNAEVFFLGPKETGTDKYLCIVLELLNIVVKVISIPCLGGFILFIIIPLPFI